MQTSEAANQEGSSYLGSLSRRHEGQQMVTGGLGADNIFINGLWTLLKQGLQQILIYVLRSPTQFKYETWESISDSRWGS